MSMRKDEIIIMNKQILEKEISMERAREKSLSLEKTEKELLVEASKLDIILQATPSQIECLAKKVSLHAATLLISAGEAKTQDFLTAFWNTCRSSIARSNVHKLFSYLVYGSKGEKIQGRKIIRQVIQTLVCKESIVLTCLPDRIEKNEIETRMEEKLFSPTLIAFFQPDIPSIVLIRQSLRKLQKICTEEILIREWRSLQFK